MKRLIALLISLLVLALPALAEPMSVFDYTDDLLEDGSLIYYFPEISLTLPAEWRGRVMAQKEDGGTAFYQKASYEKYLAEGIEGGGFLFRLGASVNSSFSELPAFEYLGFCEASAMNYYLELPSDYPAYFEDDIRAEYDAMYGQLDFVVSHANIYSAQPTAEAGEPGGVTENSGDGGASWTPAEVRYQFEHSMLPRYFYDSPEAMLNGIADVGLRWLWESVSTENGVDPYYPAGDYAERWYASDDGTILVQAELPRPDAETLCFRIYFIYNPDTGNRAYYTVEYDSFLEESSFICKWDADRTHTMLDGAPILDRNGEGYEAALLSEAARVAELAGISPALSPIEAPAAEPDAGSGDTDTSGLSLISCPELGFSTMADPAYSWDYQEGTGISIYTDSAGSIPYVIIWQSGDTLGEPMEYIREQYTPSVQRKYGDDLVSWIEYEAYEIGGKQLPAGLYTYRLQGYLIDMLRLYDSTGACTVTYTAKYVDGNGDATLAALDTAIRCYRAE